MTEWPKWVAVNARGRMGDLHDEVSGAESEALQADRLVPIDAPCIVCRVAPAESFCARSVSLGRETEIRVAHVTEPVIGYLRNVTADLLILLDDERAESSRLRAALDAALGLAPK